MNRTKTIFGLGLLVATCAVAIAAVDAITLKYAPKVGDSLKYKMTGQLQIMGTSADIAGDFEYKVTKVDTDGSYTIESSQKNMQVSFGGQNMNPPDSKDTTVSKANGEIVDYQTDHQDPNAWRMAELNSFVYPDKPVSVGDTWQSKVAADTKKGTVAATCDYKVDSLEKVGSHDTAKIKVSYKETEGSDPASSEGFVWLDTKDSAVVKSEANWTNVPSQQGPISAKISLSRVD